MDGSIGGSSPKVALRHSCDIGQALICARRPFSLILGGPCLGMLGFAFAAGSQVTMRQGCSAYAEEPLRTVGLLEAAHQYSLQDLCGPALTFESLRRCFISERVCSFWSAGGAWHELNVVGH